MWYVRALFRDTRAVIKECVASWAKWLKRNGLLCMVVLAADDYNSAKVKQYDGMVIVHGWNGGLWAMMRSVCCFLDMAGRISCRPMALSSWMSRWSFLCLLKMLILTRPHSIVLLLRSCSVGNMN